MMVAAVVILVIAALVIVSIVAGRSVKIVQQYEQGVVFSRGQMLPGSRGPGLTLISPVGQRMQRVNMQIVAMNLPGQEGITRDNVRVRVGATFYYRVVDPIRAATINMQDYMSAVSQQAQTSLRSIISQSDARQLLAERGSVNRELQWSLNEATEGNSGIRVEAAKIKSVFLPEGMKR
jgi:regulator of protease activity HflC (stomatin/prohibitin superfamily)